MTTFTSSLSDQLLKELNDTAKKYNTAKNKIIEKALSIYLDQLKKAEYAKSYRQAGADEDTMLVAEEGMEEYITALNKEDATR